MDTTGVRTPDPDDHDDGGVGFPVDAEEVPDAQKPYIHLMLQELRKAAGALQHKLVVHAENTNEANDSTVDEQPTKLYGMDVIKEMSTADLVEECVQHQREMFEQLPHRDLIRAVIRMRMATYQHRLIHEAGLDSSWSMDEE